MNRFLLLVLVLAAGCGGDDAPAPPASKAAPFPRARGGSPVTSVTASPSPAAPGPHPTPCPLELDGSSVRADIAHLEAAIASGCAHPVHALKLAAERIRAGELEKALREIQALGPLDGVLARSAAGLVERVRRIERAKEEAPVLSLVLLEAYDPRFPVPLPGDITEILTEFRRVVRRKLGDSVVLAMASSPRESVADLFAASTHRTSPEHREDIRYQYDLALGVRTPTLVDPANRPRRLEFLRSWPLPSLVSMMGEPDLKSYELFHDRLLERWHEKVEWLKSRRLPGGEPMLTAPLEPVRSDLHWKSLLEHQDRFDILFTNGFIMLDDTRTPYPHVVLKHGKIGGFAARSPRREAMDGSSLLVNVFEWMGGVEGICPVDLDRSARNRQIGALLLAHEFGHAYFGIPDVYDHGEDCLMNSSAHTLDYAAALEALNSNPRPCKLCEPYLITRVAMSNARRMRDLDCPGLAAGMYRIAIDGFPRTRLDAYEAYHALVAEARAVWIQNGAPADLAWLASYDAGRQATGNVTSSTPGP